MLTLPIKKRWFDMIAAGEKTEEYREIKPYWTARFNAAWQGSLIGGEAERRVAFRNGYSGTAPTMIATVTLDTGPGQEEWGAEPGKEYYRLHIRKVETETKRMKRSNRKPDDEAIKAVRGLSARDKIRLLQCVFCKNNPETCGCSERNEDEKGMCKKYNGHKM